MRRVEQAGAIPVTAIQVLLEYQRDWAHKDTYDAVMDCKGTHWCLWSRCRIRIYYGARRASKQENMKQEGVAVEETYTGNTMDAGNPVTTIVTWEIQEGRKSSLKHGDMKLRSPLLNSQGI